MKYLLSKSSTLLVILLILLMTGQGLASGFVLCVGESGRTTFEQGLAGKCAPAQPSCVEEECSCSSHNDDHCGACNDFSAASDSLHGRSRGDQDLANALAFSPVAAVPSPITLSARHLPIKLSALPPPQPTTALIALRTIVLLN